MSIPATAVAAPADDPFGTALQTLTTLLSKTGGGGGQAPATPQTQDAFETALAALTGLLAKTAAPASDDAAQPRNAMRQYAQAPSRTVTDAGSTQPISAPTERERVVGALMTKQGFVYPGVPQGERGDPGPDQAEQTLNQWKAHKRSVNNAMLAPSVASLDKYEPNMRPIAEAHDGDRRVLVPGWDELVESAGAAVKTGLEAAIGTMGATGGPAGAVVTGALRTAQRLAPGAMNRLMPTRPGTSVPAADARPAMEEGTVLRNAMRDNPYVQAIKGRQGFPTKAEQAELLEQHLARGGRLSEEGGGPWGRHDVQADVRGAVQQGHGARQAERVSTDAIYKLQDAIMASGEITGKSTLGEIADAIAKKTGVPREVVLERLWNKP